MPKSMGSSPTTFVGAPETAVSNLPNLWLAKPGWSLAKRMKEVSCLHSARQEIDARSPAYAGVEWLSWQETAVDAHQ